MTDAPTTVAEAAIAASLLTALRSGAPISPVCEVIGDDWTRRTASKRC